MIFFERGHPEAKAGPGDQRARRPLAKAQTTGDLDPAGIPAGSERRLSRDEGKGNPHHDPRTPGCQVDSELAVDPSDTIVIKKRYSAFYDTALDRVLADLRPDGLI